jgi:predicted transposase/invertase (TIGR01784 family)
MIFTQRRLDPGLPLHYRDFENSPRFHRVYLDEIPEDVANRSLELGIVQLIGVKQEVAPERAKQLIARAKQEVTDATAQKKILELVETVIVYKFPDLSSQEIAAMLGLSELKQTRVYQEALKEGRREGKQEEALAR